MQNFIEHGYKHGLNMEVSQFKDGVESRTLSHLPREQLRFPTEGLEEVRNRVLLAMAKSSCSGLPGNSVEWTLVPAQEDSGRVTVLNPGWGCNSIKDPLAWRDLVAYSAADPQTALLVYNGPGVGLSSPYGRGFDYEPASMGHFAGLGEYLLRHLKEPLLDADRIDVVGDSQGARYAIGMTAAVQEVLDKKVAQLRLLDPPGSREHSLLGMIYRFMVVEGARAGRTAAASSDLESRQLQAELDSREGFIAKLLELIDTNGVVGLVGQIRALCHQTLEEELELALPNVDELLQVNTPECSALTDPGEVQEILRRASHQQNRPTVIEHRVLENRSHSLHAGNPWVLGQLMSRS